MILQVGPREANDFEYAQMEISAMRQGIRAYRARMSQLGEFLRLEKNGDLYFHGHLVSYVYDMDGYLIRNYEPECELSWRGRRLIEESNVIRTPGMPIEMICQKRMQAELSKPEVMSKYLNPEEVALLQTTIGPIYEFDNMSEARFAELL